MLPAAETAEAHVNMWRRRTCDAQSDVVHVVLVVFRRDLTMVDALVARRYVLDDEAPLVRSLVEVDAQSRVGSERVQADRQWMRVTLTTPRHLSRNEGPFTPHAAPCSAARHRTASGVREKFIRIMQATRRASAHRSWCLLQIT